MKKSKWIIFLSISIFFSILVLKIISLNVLNHQIYQDKILAKTNIYVKGTSAPRGRILDVNGTILVDNKALKTIVYHKIKGISLDKEIEIAKKLANILDIDEANIKELKNYYLIIHNNGDNLIKEEEYQLYKERKLTKEDIDNLKLERITEDLLDDLSLEEKKAAKIYALMNKGYNYSSKEIKRNVREEEYAQVIEADLAGVTGEITWERVYNYPGALRSILGSLGSIPKEELNDYLLKGYAREDIVGISYLEKEYENYLKGENALYKVNHDYTLQIIKEAQKGNDLVLNIDINIQNKVESIIKEKLALKSNYRNTEYYHDSYALISNPVNGAIIAMAGIRLNDDGSFSDITSNIINSSFTMGSAVKGATIAVGYQNNLIKVGEYITDACVKLNLVPKKCSHDSLGRINDIDALALSSNYYQYLIAINLVGKKYYPNMVLGANIEHFNIYRNTLKSFGLGSLTGIDLPNEQIGIIGKTIADDLLLNLAIGQYDTYTPIELLQYINTIATKKRIAPRLMQKIVNKDKVIYESNSYVLNELTLDDLALNRIREGLSQVLKRGTGKGFTNRALNAVGKTGTSESFYDSNFDGLVDVETITSTFAGYFPQDNPKYSVVVITPNVSHKGGIDNSKYYAAYKITREITDFLGGIS